MATLAKTLLRCFEITGNVVKAAFVDCGYRGCQSSDYMRLHIAGQRRGMKPTLKRKLKRRNTIEPIIRHMKAAEQTTNVVDLIPAALARFRELVTNMEQQAIDPAEAREALRELLGDEIPLHPTDDGILEARLSFKPQKELRLASKGQPGVDFDGSGGRI